MDNKFEEFYDRYFQEDKKIFEPLYAPKWKLVIIRDIYQSVQDIPNIVVKADSARDAWRFFEKKRMKDYPYIARLYKYDKGGFTFKFVPTDDIDHKVKAEQDYLDEHPPRLPYRDD